ncbi:hypothetical protein D3C72_2256590 [compost metagenome]
MGAGLGVQTEKRARLANSQQIAFEQRVVDMARPSARIGGQPHAQAVHATVGRVTAQRILADQPVAQFHVDMGARRIGR